MKPPESFVPLTAAPTAPAPQEFRVTVLNGHDHAAAGDSRPTRPAGFQSLETPVPAFTNNASAGRKIGEPRVSVQRDGDRVTHLRIQCPCGQIIDLACVYDAPPPPP